MKQIPNQFRKNSFDYTLLHRTERVALYSQEDAGKLVAFEVHRIQSHDGRTIGGQTLEPAEFLASTEQFGSQAWSLPTLPAAMARFAEQETLLASHPVTA